MSKHNESGLLPELQYAQCFTECIDYERDLSEVAVQNGNYSKFTMAG